ncbi:hypothetical protein [Croceicoccus naphthovorans]|uniref:Uncharacterized protein n=1 Tax=Croceicoccus naphthovorans TaxID=1348774 RepID=A0A0G3XHT5_9SPHN|nr:hypothetical protein [Croceicoccus naphthovorans]AKM10164.1 hypothetical protein AB433_09565 [Croceicoccus naphthovorans]MBB3990605.1 phosphoglycerol transferase MdoB-like AlkP superfamily enzyme [Croceicoccus naphthovorans]
MQALFASDLAFWLAIAGLALALAVLAFAGDWRRFRRAHADRVGCMPWTSLFLLALFIAAVAGFFAFRAWVDPL